MKGKEGRRRLGNISHLVLRDGDDQIGALGSTNDVT
jgi:hypothetical protein